MPMQTVALDESTLSVWAAMRRDFWGDDDETVQADFLRYQKRQPAGESYSFFARDEGGQYLGFVDAELRRDYVEGATDSPYKPVWYLEGIYVIPAKRGSGVGAFMLAHLEAFVRSRGGAELASDCELANTASEAFHKAEGFKEAQRNIHFIKRLD